jgi:hypothetical protein
MPNYSLPGPVVTVSIPPPSITDNSNNCNYNDNIPSTNNNNMTFIVNISNIPSTNNSSIPITVNIPSTNNNNVPITVNIPSTNNNNIPYTVDIPAQTFKQDNSNSATEGGQQVQPPYASPASASSAPYSSSYDSFSASPPSSSTSSEGRNVPYVLPVDLVSTEENPKS